MLILSKSHLHSTKPLVKCLLDNKYYIYNLIENKNEVDFGYDYIAYRNDDDLLVEISGKYYAIDCQGNVKNEVFLTPIELMLTKKADSCPSCLGGCAECFGTGVIPLNGNWDELLD